MQSCHEKVEVEVKSVNFWGQKRKKWKILKDVEIRPE